MLLIEGAGVAERSPGMRVARKALWEKPGEVRGLLLTLKSSTMNSIESCKIIGIFCVYSTSHESHTVQSTPNLVPLNSLDMLNLLPNPRRKRRTKIITKLDAEIIISFIGHPFDRKLGFGVFFQTLDGWTEGDGHGCCDAVFVPSFP